MPRPSQRLDILSAPGLKRALVPSACSLAIHLVLLAVVATVTWTVVGASDRPKGGAEIILDFDDPGAKPQPGVGHQEPTESVRAPRLEAPSLPAAPRDLLTSGRPSAQLPPSALSPLLRAPAPPRLAPERAQGISFAGVRAGRAASVVYVIDASGAMTASLAFVFDELERSLARLGPEQQFQIVVCRDRTGVSGRRESPAQVFGGPGVRRQLLPASESNRQRAVRWLRDEILPSGRSDPLPGLEAALTLDPRPEAVFLLTRSIPRTQNDDDTSPWSPQGMERLLRRLDQLNPEDPATGRRPVLIKSIQFLEDDSSGLLQEMGRRHGGDSGYTLRTRRDIEELTNRPAPIVEIDEELNQAAAILAELSRDATDLHVVYGMPSSERRQRAALAARNAIALARSAADPSDPLAIVVLARAATILACAADADSDRAAALDLARRSIARAPEDVAPVLRLQRASIAVLTGDAPVALPDPLQLESEPLLLLESHLIAIRRGSAEELDARLSAALTHLSRTPLAVSPGRADPALLVLTLDAAAARAIGLAAGSTDADSRLLSRAFEILLSIQHLRIVDLSPDDRRAIAFDRVAAAISADTPLERVPPEVSLVRAHMLEPTDADAAIDVLREAMVRDDAEPLMPELFAELGSLLSRQANFFRRVEGASMWITLAEGYPASPLAVGARERALFLARRLLEDQRQGEPRYRDALSAYESVLRSAVSYEPLQSRDAWAAEHDRVLLELAALHDSVFSLHLLQRIRAGAPQAPFAVVMYRRLLDATLLKHWRTFDELRDDPSARERAEIELETIARHVQEALGFYLRHGVNDTASERADLADALRLLGQPDSDTIYRELLNEQADVPGGRYRLLLGLALVERAGGNALRAFEHLREITDALAGPGESPDTFWEAWTTTLEILASETESRQRVGTARAHLARLRTIDPFLGGERYRDRLEAISRRLSGD